MAGGLYWLSSGQIDPARAVTFEPRSVRTSGGEELVAVAEVMSSPVFSLLEQQPVEAAVGFLEENELHHLPLVDSDGVLVGLVSDRDLYDALDTLDEPISLFMTRELLVTFADTTLRDAAGAMMARKISCLPVIDRDRRPVGIVTVADMLGYLVGHPSMKLWD